MDHIVKPLVISFIVFAVVILISLVLLSVFIKKRIKGLAKQMDISMRHAVFIWIILMNWPVSLFTRFLMVGRWIGKKGNFFWKRNKTLVVTNHPAWVDQGALIQMTLSYLEWFKDPNIFPYIGTAKDSIIRLPFLRILETFYILKPIERQKLEEAAMVEGEMVKILSNGSNLIISGPAGRDFKKKDGGLIFSPIKNKPLRKFGGLCGRLSTLPDVITQPIYIEGTDKLFVEKTINGKMEMVFSSRKFFVDFLLLRRFKVFIVIGESLILEGCPKMEARRKIEEAVLHLADTC